MNVRQSSESHNSILESLQNSTRLVGHCRSLPNRTAQLYVVVNRPTMYSSVVTGEYLGSLPQFGRHDISALKFGLQKNAMDCRAGVMTSISFNFSVGGATTRCKVDRRTSLLQRAKRSPALITIVPGWISCLHDVELTLSNRLTMGGAAWKCLV